MIIAHKYETIHMVQSCVYDYSHHFLNYGNDETSHIVQNCVYDENSRNNGNSYIHNFVLDDLFHIYV